MKYLLGLKEHSASFHSGKKWFQITVEILFSRKGSHVQTDRNSVGGLESNQDNGKD